MKYLRPSFFFLLGKGDKRDGCIDASMAYLPLTDATSQQATIETESRFPIPPWLAVPTRLRAHYSASPPASRVWQQQQLQLGTAPAADASTATQLPRVLRVHAVGTCCVRQYCTSPAHQRMCSLKNSSNLARTGRSAASLRCSFGNYFLSLSPFIVEVRFYVFKEKLFFFVCDGLPYVCVIFCIPPSGTRFYFLVKVGIM